MFRLGTRLASVPAFGYEKQPTLPLTLARRMLILSVISGKPLLSFFIIDMRRWSSDACIQGLFYPEVTRLPGGAHQKVF